MALSVSFGYLPRALDIQVGNVSVSTLDGLDETIRSVSTLSVVHQGWIYSPPARTKNFMTGTMHELPFPARVFGLPTTHLLSHATAIDPDHTRFLIWVMGFIYGMRLSDTEAGFLDATPIELGKLHDIVWQGNSDTLAIAIADGFWHKYASEPRISKGIIGIIHSLFLGQNPTLLDFEEFTYLYIALDGCHAVWSAMNGQRAMNVGHPHRISNLCSVFNCPIPPWAVHSPNHISSHRNETIHEGLFFEEPLGFRIFGGTPVSGIPTARTLLEMRSLTSRFLCAILGFDDISYITSRVDTRQRHGVQL